MLIQLSKQEQSDIRRLTSVYGWAGWFIEQAQEKIPTFSTPVLSRLRKNGTATEEYVAVALSVLQTEKAQEQLKKLKKAKRD